MMRLFVYRYQPCLAMVFAIASACFAQTGEIAKDERLQKPVSLKMKIVPVTVALQQFSKVTGVRLDHVSTIEDLKVTVFVHDVPSGTVLDKIAKVLGCEWQADGGSYRLGMTQDEQTRRERYIAEEDTESRKEIETQLNQIAEAVNGPEIPFGRFLKNLDAAKINAFWRGDVIVGAPAVAPIVSDSGGDGSSAQGDAIQSRRVRRAPSGTPMFVQYDPMLYQVRVASRGTVRVIAKRPPQLITRFAPEGVLAGLPFGKEVLSWDEPVPIDGDLANVSVMKDETKSEYSDGRVSIADFFEKAFDQTHVPVIVDGFRTPAFSKDLNRGIGPLSSWLAILKKENNLFTRFEDGAILVRHGGFWRLRKFEAPEEAYASIEAKASKAMPTIDDYATFLASLSPEQAKPFSIQNATVAKFDSRPIEQAFPALLFYSSLDSKAVAKAMQDGLIYDILGSNQRQLFVQAALEGVFLGATTNAFNDALMRLSATGDARGLGFIMRKASVDVRGLPVDGQALLFGASLSEATTYKIGLSE